MLQYFVAKRVKCHACLVARPHPDGSVLNPVHYSSWPALFWGFSLYNTVSRQIGRLINELKKIMIYQKIPFQYVNKSPKLIHGCYHHYRSRLMMHVYHHRVLVLASLKY